MQVIQEQHSEPDTMKKNHKAILYAVTAVTVTVASVRSMRFISLDLNLKVRSEQSSEHTFQAVNTNRADKAETIAHNFPN
jgi:hypothetical protein